MNNEASSDFKQDVAEATEVIQAMLRKVDALLEVNEDVEVQVEKARVEDATAVDQISEAVVVAKIDPDLDHNDTQTAHQRRLLPDLRNNTDLDSSGERKRTTPRCCSRSQTAWS